MNWNQTKKERRRESVFKIIAFIFAMITLFGFLLLPMYIFRVTKDIPLDAKGLEGEIWFLIIGGGIGTGAAYLGLNRTPNSVKYETSLISEERIS